LPRESYAATNGVTIEIPSLGVKMPVVGVPFKNGAWNVSWQDAQAGWLEGTAFPSWNGNSVLTGHVYLANGLPGPFVNLYTLKYGEKVIVHAYGQAYTFEVRSNEIVEPNNTSAFKPEERPWLTLITCKEYDEKTNIYRKRVVIRAVLVSVTAE
jgi:LPXTG-site transpeptidase (sortase) family protein